MPANWVCLDIPDHAVRPLAQALDIEPLIARLLIRLGITDIAEARYFLEPKLKNLTDPFQIHNVQPAVDRLLKALKKRESILVIGDYDVDGVTSTALLVKILRLCGSHSVRYLMPRRHEEGYGLSQAVITRGLSEEKPDLLIALDCGTNSATEVKDLRLKGVDVIIIDHHRAKEKLPENCILVNPHAYTDKKSQSSVFCTVGLVFKVVHGIIKQLRKGNDARALAIRLSDYLYLVALGTVADIVPLNAENRILVRHGLNQLMRSRHCGIRTFLNSCGISLGHKLLPADISFRLGPRINASGRLADATLPVQMLLSENFGECRQIADSLHTANRERQEIEKQIFLEAEAQVAAGQKNAAALVVYGSQWHTGVVGIVAGRLSRKYNRPCFALGREGERAKGSGRSITGLNLVDALTQCSHLLESWGGHPMAVGVVLNVGQVSLFREIFCNVIKSNIGENPTHRSLEFVDWLPLSAINNAFLDELEALSPYGEGNPEPVFGLQAVMIQSPPEVFGAGHYRFGLPLAGNQRLNGIAWRQAHRILPANVPVDLLVKIGWSYWNNRRFQQAELIDWRLSSS